MSVITSPSSFELRSPSWEERRESPRNPVSRALCCHLLAFVGEDGWPARVLDVSMGGISLTFSRCYKPSGSVRIELMNGLWHTTLVRSLRVVHVVEQPDGTTVIGGEFESHLTYAELHSLLW